MFELPDNFEWLSPWSPIGDESVALEWGEIQSELESGQRIADRLVAELQREMPAGHVLKNCQLAVVGKCDADPNEFLFTADSSTAALAMVHLTWRTEADPTWPYTDTYRTLDDWIAQMRKEHLGHITQSDENGG